MGFFDFLFRKFTSFSFIIYVLLQSFISNMDCMLVKNINSIKTVYLRNYNPFKIGRAHV